MQPRVVGVGDQPLDRPALDPLGRPGTCRAHLRELRLCLRHFYLRSVGCVWHPRTGDLAHRDQAARSNPCRPLAAATTSWPTSTKIDSSTSPTLNSSSTTRMSATLTN